MARVLLFNRLMMDANSTLRIVAYTEMHAERDVARRAFFPGSVLLDDSGTPQQAGIAHNPMLPRGVLPTFREAERKEVVECTRPTYSLGLESYPQPRIDPPLDEEEQKAIDVMMSHVSAHQVSHSSVADPAAFEEPTARWDRPAYMATMILPTVDDEGHMLEPAHSFFSCADSPTSTTTDSRTANPPLSVGERVSTLPLDVDIEEPLSEREWEERINPVSIARALGEEAHSSRRWPWIIAFAFSSAVGGAVTVFGLIQLGVFA